MWNGFHAGPICAEMWKSKFTLIHKYHNGTTLTLSELHVTNLPQSSQICPHQNIQVADITVCACGKKQALLVLATLLHVTGFRSRVRSRQTRPETTTALRRSRDRKRVWDGKTVFCAFDLTSRWKVAICERLSLNSKSNHNIRQG